MGRWLWACGLGVAALWACGSDGSGPERGPAGEAARVGDRRTAPPAATTRDIRVDGPLDRGVIARAMRTRRPALGRCVELELARDPDFAARVTASFTAAPSGRLSPIRVEPDVSETFTACLKGALRAMQMPRAEASTEVSVEIELAP